MFRMDKLSPQGSARRRMRYAEWRSLFIAKRLKMKKNRRICDFSTLFSALEFANLSGILIHSPFCGLGFFNISFYLHIFYTKTLDSLHFLYYHKYERSRLFCKTQKI